MKGALRWTVIAALAAVLALAAYETFAVLRARAHTPAALAAVSVRPLRLEQVPPRWTDALLKVTDPGFYHHHGLDFSTPGQGMTTLTQALVKRMYFRRFHKGFAKLEQDLVARLVLDPAMSKRDQLEAFFNYAYLGHQGGHDVIGFPAAARAWYGVDFARLSDRQFLSLVAMLNNPDLLDPKDHAAANAERTDRIERLLAGLCKPRDWRDVDYPDCAQTPPSPRSGRAL